MIKELKLVFFILVITFFLIFTARYYFSDENKKNMFRSANDIDGKIESFTENLVVLKNNTDEIIKYVEIIFRLQSHISSNLLKTIGPGPHLLLNES